ncbi:hypothetical protein ACOMCU_24380 [Lysinibacillus sp. UGB7]|uniref:hypothetical protein n=1 Tax=Lysinibacillus sp. UGB7 TaxID=3411039 RepID=UPI003B7B792A
MTEDLKLYMGKGKILKTQRFQNSGTFVVPAGVTEVYITGCGGGGGGSVSSSTGWANGHAGGLTSFGGITNLNGGGGGGATDSSLGLPGAVPGIAGGYGGQSGEGPIYSATSGVPARPGRGGNSGPFHGGLPSYSNGITINGGYGSGGAGYTASTGGFSAGGGGAHYVEKFPVTVTPLKSYAVTIGAGGKGGNINSYNGGYGGNGLLIVQWWE